MNRSSVVIWSTVAVLLLSVAFFFQGSRAVQNGHLRITFLNIGQGDATLIQSPTGQTVLIDGGPDRSVLRELGAVLPWWQRSIDVVVATHPDADHISGLVDVLEKYKVSTIVEPGIGKNTPQAESLLVAVSRKKPQEIIARRGQIIDIGRGAYLEVLHPDRDVSTAETNDGCVVTRLVYGKTSVMLSCDAPRGVEKYLISLDGTELGSAVLKAGHHGSKTSSDPLFIGFVNPQYGVFSRGCHNHYGHPNKETVNTLQRFDIETHDTCLEGRVMFESDGTQISKL